MTGKKRGLKAALCAAVLAVSGTVAMAQSTASSTSTAVNAKYAEFLAALRHMESRGNYRAVNTLNFIGAYQFGEAALIDLGYVRRDGDPYDNNYGGGFTGKHGIRSVKDFLNHPEVQDRAAQTWLRTMWRYIQADGLSRHAWTKVGDVTLTPSGMLAATHLLGTGALKEFIRSDGRANIRDPYGMPLATYITKVQGYDVPFGPKRPQKYASLN
ncbi:hypothetical protein [Ostreiculturibacter nitratireducens]|uniref:hypothetical protein n=1 Tax=Ostreiculturibacter nitratireducens TaxID=3075226 RepID=UPI0031B58283